MLTHAAAVGWRISVIPGSDRPDMDSGANPIFGCMPGRKGQHVVVWTEAHGAVPDGYIVYRMCRRSDCCTLYHLELVTKSELEKLKSWKHRCKRERCPQGHDLKLQGQVTPEGGITCRACHREAHAEARGAPLR